MEQVSKPTYIPDNNTNVQNDTNTNNPNEFEKIESINKTQVQPIKPQFDFYKDFEMRELLEKNSTESNLNNDDKNKEIDMMLNSFPLINDNLRANILLSVEIYKKINNFEMTYVHKIINENTKKNI